MSDSIDLQALARDLDAIKAEVCNGRSAEDVAHLKKVERWGRLCGVLGLLTAWMIPNPISAFLLSQAKLTRWTMVAHHVLHKGYDKIPGICDRYTSKGFAQGRRRFIDWFDWMLPEAWILEHNQLHHYHLGEEVDPDLVERRVAKIRKLRLPVLLKVLIAVFCAGIWKMAHFAVVTLNALLEDKKSKSKDISYREYWNPLNPKGRELWLRCYLPYMAWNFILLPLLFFPLGVVAVINVWLNQVLAELLTNLHSFMVVVTNHAGEDLCVFQGRSKSKGEFYYRQIVGSTNYTTGGDLTDFLHGWLNYQIEHHLWPDMTMLQYRKAQPQVKAICEKHGISYIQESVFLRTKKTIRIIIGRASMRGGI